MSTGVIDIPEGIGGEGKAATGGAVSAADKKIIQTGEENLNKLLNPTAGTAGVESSFSPALTQEEFAAREAAYEAEKLAAQQALTGEIKAAVPVHHKAAKAAADVAKPSALLRATDIVVKPAGALVSAAGSATMVTDFGLAGAAGAAGFLAKKTPLKGMGSVEANLRKPLNWLNNLSEEEVAAGGKTRGQMVNNGVMIGFSALGAYNVVKDFDGQLSALKSMYSDLTGVPVEQVSTMKILTGKMPPMLEEPRNHLRTEFVGRGLIQGVGLALMIKMAGKPASGTGWKSNLKTMIPLLGPQLASQAYDAMMGQSVMPVYAAFTNAFNAGQEIPAHAYSEFVLAASHDLKIRGPVGKKVADEVGAQYAAEKANPKAILQEINSDKFMIRVKGLIATAEVEHEAKVAAAKERAAEAKLHPSEAVQTGHHTAKLEGNAAGRQNKEILGGHTKRVVTAASNPAVAPGLNQQ